MTNPPDPSADLDHLLGPEGPVAAALATAGGGYEPRPQQRTMAHAVADALSSERHLVVEAGTGVGKSFAYLVPLLRWAEEHDATVAVATSTIALQEQLVRKDLPLLAAALPFDVTFTLVKGRANYLCLRRMNMALVDAPTLFEGDGPRLELERIRAWSTTTREGSRQDLPFRPQPAVWDLVRAEQGNCKGRNCEHFSQCPYQRSRRRAHQARCLVLNHHVLMADLALRRSGASFLPQVGGLVIDEAHDLEDTAAEHLGLRASSLGVAILLGRLWQPRGGRGLLARHGNERLRQDVEYVRETAQGFFDALRGWTESNGDGGGIAPLADAFPVPDAVTLPLRELAAELIRAGRSATDEDAVMELLARGRQVEAAAETLEGIIVPRDGEVRWAERTGRGGVAVSSAPVEVGPLLQEVLWDAHPTVVLTSATLSTGRPPSFAFLSGRLGLASAESLSVGSPFDFRQQARVVLRTDLPDPARDPSGYEAALPEAVLSAVRRTRGGAFVLFTGYGAMRRTVEALRATLEADGLTVLVQGESLERPAMLERFRREDAVLFGVASFWQGVDVPGERLRHVVIARLPFEVPTHPLQRARAERIAAEGKDPFRELSLPTAAIRLKQGFGRLIRRRDDRGIVTILDPRVVTRHYGRVLLASLPECEVERAGPPGVLPL